MCAVSKGLAQIAEAALSLEPHECPGGIIRRNEVEKRNLKATNRESILGEGCAMYEIDLKKAKAEANRSIETALEGQEVVITKDDKPV